MNNKINTLIQSVLVKNTPDKKTYHNEKEGTYSTYFKKSKFITTSQDEMVNFVKGFRTNKKEKNSSQDWGIDINTGFSTDKITIRYTNGDELVITTVNTSVNLHVIPFVESTEKTYSITVEIKEYIDSDTFQSLREELETKYTHPESIIERFDRINKYGYHRKNGSVVPCVFTLRFPGDLEITEHYFHPSSSKMKKLNPMNIE